MDGVMMKVKISRFVLIWFVCIFAVRVGDLSAGIQQELLSNPIEPHPVAEKAISRLKSPYCPGLMLEVCTSLEGAMLRDSLQAMALEGGSMQELVDWVISNHGEEYLAYPRTSGAGLMAWVVPPGVLILGVSVLILFLKYMREDEVEPSVVRVISEEEEVLLREALKEMEASEEAVF
jgi:cytochrome c-type biogenesis protein CcmH/NrfF|tara:strand:+ start:14529 stop:15059 length:531 start_codon:yes stop_codon:yes gene_type:complete